MYEPGKSFTSCLTIQLPRERYDLLALLADCPRFLWPFTDLILFLCNTHLELQEINNEWQIGISEPQKAGEGVMGTYMVYTITIKVRLVFSRRLCSCFT